MSARAEVLSVQEGARTTPKHWWDRQHRSKFSLRLVAMGIAFQVTFATYGYAWTVYILAFVMSQVGALAVEGMAALWPSAFGSREHTLRRIRAAWRSFNAVQPVGDTNAPHRDGAA